MTKAATHSLIVFIIALFLTSVRVLASEEAVELLMKAYQSSGANPSFIHSGSAGFTVDVVEHFNVETTDNAYFSEERIKLMEEEIRKMFKWNRLQMKAELERLKEERNIQFPEIQTRQIEMSILMLGNDRFLTSTDGKLMKRRIERKEILPQWDSTSNKETQGEPTIIDTVTISMGSPNQPDTCVDVKWIPNSRTVQYVNSDGELEEFQLFGRMQDMPWSWIGEVFRSKLNRQDFSFPADSLPHFMEEIEKLGLTCEITGDEIYDETEKAKVVEVKEGNTLLEKYLIDPSRDYICPYLYTRDPSGEYSQECVARNYSKIENYGLLYPSSYIFTFQTTYGNTQRTYQLKPDSLIFNQPVAEHEFAIDVPRGGTIYRTIKDKNPPDKFMIVPETVYYAIEPGTISLTPGGYDLDSMSWLEKEEPEDENEYMPSAGGTKGPVRWVLVGIGIGFLLAALALQLYISLCKNK